MSEDELLAEARARLHELEEQGGESDELGERVELAPGDYFRGRFRGEAAMRTKEGDLITVVALWDNDDRPRFHYRNRSLADELELSRPTIGDEIVIVRGDDVEFEAQGEQRRMHRYSVAVRNSGAPLPGAPSDSEKIPF
jgi:hypothetical protein